MKMKIAYYKSNKTYLQHIYKQKTITNIYIVTWVGGEGGGHSAKHAQWKEQMPNTNTITNTNTKTIKNTITAEWKEQ